jgi:hypothetical protein
MSTRVLTGAALAALAGAAMLAISASSASAFTLSSPSLEQPMASSNIDHVWCHHCGGWGWGHHWGGGWGWGHHWGPGWGPGYVGPACPWGYHLGPYGHHCWPN